MRKFTKVLAVLAMTALTSISGFSSTALADEGVDKGIWDKLYAASSTCTAGSNSRVCTFDIDTAALGCAEATASSGTGAQASINCRTTVQASVTVQPRLSAAGRVLGCTSVTGTHSGNANFDSSVSNTFDQAYITVTQVTVQGVTLDQTNATVHILGRYSDGLQTWTLDAVVFAPCGPSSGGSSLLTSGSVEVAVVT